MTITYEQVMELLPAYAIGALEVEEQDAVDKYFYLQDELRQRLAASEAATLLLAQNAAHAEMAVDAHERLAARVRSDVEAETKAEARIEVEVETEIEATAETKAEAGTLIADVVSGTDHASIARKSAASPLTRKRVVQRTTPMREPRAEQMADPQSGQARSAARTGQPRKVEARGPRSKPSFFSNLIMSFSYSLINKRALATAALAASVATVVFLGGLSSLLYGQTRSLREQSGALLAENSMLMETNQQIQSGRAALLDEYTDLEIVYEETALERRALYEENQRLQNQLTANSERITLVGAASQATVMFGTEEAPGLQGTFFHKDEEGALVVHGLEPLPVDQAYQFWLVTTEGEQVSAGLFAVDEDLEPTWANLTLPSDVPPYNIVGVTIEPATGSTAPTGPMLLESSVDFGESSS